MSLYFTKDHEWVQVDGDVATVGITDYAQAQLGDIVFVELPAIDAVLEQGKEAAVVESVKAASDIYAPLSGTVRDVNVALETEPALANSAPEAAGWFFQMHIANPAELASLLDAAGYKALVDSL